MVRPIWKGSISFGLVNIPVTLLAAEERKEMSFKMLDSRNNAAVKYQRINEVTKEDVPWDDIVKGYEYEDGEYVLLGDEDFKRAAPEATQSIDIDNFVPEDSIPPEYFDKPYYLVPAKKGERPYALLREALSRTKSVAVAKVVIRTRQYLAAVMVRDRALILELLRFAHEIRKVPEDQLPSENLESLKITEKELDLAEQLVKSMAAPWKPEGYKDEYHDSLMAWIKKKVDKGETAPVAEADEDEPKGGGEVIDMMALLKKSMAERDEKSKDKPPVKKRKASA